VAAVIRFLPDTLRDAIMRPFAMGAPDAGVYVEIMAPDVRFGVIAILALISVAVSWRSRSRLSPAGLLLVWVAAAFVIWLMTTGNGRYFVPVLIAAGPLCIALVYGLPASRGFRLALAVTVVSLQAVVVSQATPWGSWGLAPWSDAPFFDVTLDREALTIPSTYVTITNISYSLIAPRFPPSSRWVNISALPIASDRSPDVIRMQAILASSKSLKLIVPSVPDFMDKQGLPTKPLRNTINSMLGGQRLALSPNSQCRLLRSRGLASEAIKDLDTGKPETMAKFGFWVCPLEYPVPLPAPDPAVNARARQVFELIENRCPRFFQPGQTSAIRLQDGWMRVYPQSDMKLYLLDDGQVLYKYVRALNPVLIGSVDEVLSGRLETDCNAIRGRVGLPWEREI
jgi:hypothetical protein